MNSVEELNSLPSGTQIEDVDCDVWTKQISGLWSLEGRDEFYHDRTAENIVGFYSPFRALEAKESEPTEPTVEGVWIVWDSSSKENINGVFPADAEINALRLVNNNGFGYADFQPFGEVLF